jgi:hypothetical protein
LKTLLTGIVGLLLSATVVVALTPEILPSVGAVAPQVAGQFRDPKGFQLTSAGAHLVFDRRAHVV